MAPQMALLQIRRALSIPEPISDRSQIASIFQLKKD